MEKLPIPEKKEVLDQELIDALKSKGVEDPEVFQLLQKWTEQGDKECGGSRYSRGYHRIQ